MENRLVVAGVKEGGGQQEGIGYGYKTATKGSFVVMEMFIAQPYNINI